MIENIKRVKLSELVYNMAYSKKVYAFFILSNNESECTEKNKLVHLLGNLYFI